MQRYISLLIIFTGLLFQGPLSAQGPLKGVVRDCRTGEPLAFVNLQSADGRHGTSTDIEGRFVLKDVSYPIQLNFTYVGYEAKNTWINGPEKRFEVEMCPMVLSLSEVIIVPWDNPALHLMRQVVKNRDKHNPDNLDSYTCDAYGKMIFTIDTTQGQETEVELPDSTMKKIRKLLDQQHLFIMETVSEREYRKGRLKERVKGSRISGLKDPLFVFLISQIQSFSFYDELIRISDKSYLNPASPSGLKKYLFSLEDTLYRDRDTLMVVRYRPRPGTSFDGMKGLVYVNKGDYAIQNVTATPAVEDGVSISIRQKYERISGHWFPVELGTSLVLKNVIVGKYYAIGDGNYYLKDIEINREGRGSLGVMAGVEVERNAHRRDSAFWIEHRVAELEGKELETYRVIDSIGEANKLDRISRRLDALMRGYYPFGPLDLDLGKLIRYSDYEGIYGGIGLSTNPRSVPWFDISAYGGYGYGDDEVKYGADLEVPVYRRMDIKLLAWMQRDIREEGKIWDPGIAGRGQELDLRRLLIRDMDPHSQYGVGLQFRPMRDVFARVKFYKESFSFSEDDMPPFPEFDVEAPMDMASLELRYAIGEKVLMNPFNVISLGTRQPVFWLRYRRGLSKPTSDLPVLSSLEFKFEGSIRMPSAGDLGINLLAGMHTSRQPASLLFNGRGSYRPFTLFAPNSFATVRMNEFIADHFTYLFLTHNFKHHLTGNRRLPSLRLHLNLGWSSLENDALVAEGLNGMDDIFMEGGVDIPDLINLGLVRFGLGGFYRFGAYSLDNTKDNLAWKLVIGLPF